MFRVSSKKTLAARIGSVMSGNFSPLLSFSPIHSFFEFHHFLKPGDFPYSASRTHLTLRAADKNALRLYLKGSLSCWVSRMRSKKYLASRSFSLALLIACHHRSDNCPTNY